VPRVDIEHHQARHGAGDDGDVGLWPREEPILNLVGPRQPLLELDPLVWKVMRPAIR
jgi:hypothetical protein